jgi:hypothetical protein
MGALEFSNTILTRQKPQEAFRDLVERARYANGHGGYTGTIAEKDDFAMVPVPKRKSPYKVVDEIMQSDDLDKWGPALCVEVKGAWLKRMKERSGYKGKKGLRGFIFFGLASY